MVMGDAACLGVLPKPCLVRMVKLDEGAAMQVHEGGFLPDAPCSPNPWKLRRQTPPMSSHASRTCPWSHAPCHRQAVSKVLSACSCAQCMNYRYPSVSIFQVG